MNIRTCGAVIIASSVAFSATAQKPDATPDPEWVLELPEEILVDSSDAGNAADFNARVDKLTLVAGPDTSIILSCQVIQKDGQLRDSRLNVGFDLDTEKDAYKRRMSIRRMSASLTLGEVKKTYRFQWNVDTDTIVPFDRSVARKVFNAAIRGEQIKLKISGKVRIDTTLPALNEAFRTFAKNCPVTQPKQ